MYSWKLILTILLLSQRYHPANSWAIRQLNDNGNNIVSAIMPLLSALLTIPSSALQTTLNLSGTGRVNNGNSLSSFSLSNNGFGSTGSTTASFGQTGSTVGNGGVAVIRRGSELLADQLTSALSEAIILIDMLQSYEQNGQVYLGDFQTSLQGLTNRLMNTVYNGGNTFVQQLSNQAVSSPGGGDFFYRRGGGLAVTSRPTNLPFVLSRPSRQDGLGFTSNMNEQTLDNIGGSWDGFTLTRPSTNLPFVLNGPPVQDRFGLTSSTNGQITDNLGGNIDGLASTSTNIPLELNTPTVQDGITSNINGIDRQTTDSLGAIGDGIADEINNFTRDNSNGELSSTVVNAESPLGTFSKNYYSIGTTNNPPNDGQLASVLDSSLTPVRVQTNLATINPRTTITTNALELPF